VLANEGFFRALLTTATDANTNWYDVPFGAITPKRGQASNLLVPVVISATSVAYASTRIENMFMDLGSAAGVFLTWALFLDFGHFSFFPALCCPAHAITCSS